MIEVVLDVNVLASGFPAPAGLPAAILERWLRREFELVLSEHILDGVAHAWQKPYFQRRYHQVEQIRAIALLRSRATIVVPSSLVRGVAEDEEDDLVIATAVAGNASQLVTGDRRLRDLVSYHGVTILTPREFLMTLKTEAE